MEDEGPACVSSLWGNYSCVVEVLWTPRVNVELFPKLVSGHTVDRGLRVGREPPRRARPLEIGTALGPVGTLADPGPGSRWSRSRPPGSPPAYSPRGARLTNGDKADPTTSPRRGPRPGPGAQRGRDGLRPPADRASLQGAPRARDAETSKGARRRPARPCAPGSPACRSRRRRRLAPRGQRLESRRGARRRPGSHPPWLLLTWLHPPRPAPQRGPRLRPQTPGGPRPGPPWLRDVFAREPRLRFSLARPPGLHTSRHTAVLTGTPRTPVARPGLATTSLPAPKA
ncbi:PREDICTED: collagen alpha-1(VII) chain-like [Bison bison bison]|uniref:Collagen alpha-1(VII) chain-like n=1 Tax=Bison bison bison TaxID=43346 RepID=A0A6P3I9S4_BISBB|nr:PREDICTED: collagen alpha-1(VII) chain-like [Bison bison bison]